MKKQYPFLVLLIIQLIPVFLFQSCRKEDARPTENEIDKDTTLAEKSISDKIIVLATGEWAPYVSEENEGSGICTEIITAAFKKSGYETSYSFYPWKRCEVLAERGDVFATFPYRVTDERKERFYFSDKIVFSSGRFFYMKTFGTVDYTEFSDLKEYKLGGVRGYWYEKDFNEAGLIVDYSISDEINIRKLAAGRVQIAAGDEAVGWQLIYELFPDEVDSFATMNKPLNQDGLHLMVSMNYPGSERIVKDFNTGLQKIKDSGEYAVILAKYGMKDL